VCVCVCVYVCVCVGVCVCVFESVVQCDASDDAYCMAAVTTRTKLLPKTQSMKMDGYRLVTLAVGTHQGVSR